jgi:triphosphoribosyl-dephospho-CoA synthase
LNFGDFILSAAAIAPALDAAVSLGVGATVCSAIEATRRVVSTNTNLGIVLLLAPLAGVPEDTALVDGIDTVLSGTTIADARDVYHAIRLAQPGGLGEVPEQDVYREPTVDLRAAMALAADRDSIALQYANGYEQVLREAKPALESFVESGQSIETAIISTYLTLLALQPDSLIVRKFGLDAAREVSRRSALVLSAGWPSDMATQRQLEQFDAWLRSPGNRLNPGTTADLVTAAIYAALREQTVSLPLAAGFSSRLL